MEIVAGADLSEDKAEAFFKKHGLRGKYYNSHKEIVDSGVLGKIYYIQTGGGRRRGIPTPFGTTFIEDATAGIGAFGDIGCYSLDMVLNAILPRHLSIWRAVLLWTSALHCAFRY